MCSCCAIQLVSHPLLYHRCNGSAFLKYSTGSTDLCVQVVVQSGCPMYVSGAGCAVLRLKQRLSSKCNLGLAVQLHEPFMLASVVVQILFCCHAALFLSTVLYRSACMADHLGHCT